jgi:hypothetical protein
VQVLMVSLQLRERLVVSALAQQVLLALQLEQQDSMHPNFVLVENWLVVRLGQLVLQEQLVQLARLHQALKYLEE